MDFNIFPSKADMLAMAGMKIERRTRSVFSRDEKRVRGVMTKQSRSKYRPHYGAKEAAKYAARGKL